MENDITIANKNQKPRLLIVDDEAINIKILVDLFQDDFNILIAKNGPKAIKIALMEPPPDIILLDVQMPEMDGYEVCKILKFEPRLMPVPVIFLTSLSHIDDKVQGFDLGAVDYVCKPFNPRELTARVNVHVELKIAKDEIQTLRGILPVCSYCKKIRDDNGSWGHMEEYISERTEANFSHGYCPDCMERAKKDLGLTD
jgi:sigma-B regulation protein RsbU (phosphoserine phosphatase)